MPPTGSSSPPKRTSHGLLKRGFKAEAERRAGQIRSELKLTYRHALDPVALATHLGIEVKSLADLHASGELDEDALRYLTRKNRSVFSGLYMRVDGCQPHIIFNDSHAPTRQKSDITHECAHDILGHEPDEVFDGLGCRSFNAEQEAQVDYLAPALLVPSEGALWAVRGGMSDADAASHYGVSVKLYTMRAHCTGAKLRVSRSTGK